MAPALSVVALLAGCLDSDTLQRMETQPKVLPYTPNAYFADGRGMRQPPAGTVPRERLRLIGESSRGQHADGGFVQQNPLPLTRAVLERGRKRYEITCATCHGLLGDGDSVVAHNMALRSPPDLHLRRHQPDGYFFDIITHGYGLMPAFGREIPEDERWAVVAYVRALQLSQHASLDLAPDAQRQALLEGRQ